MSDRVGRDASTDPRASSSPREPASRALPISAGDPASPREPTSVTLSISAGDPAGPSAREPSSVALSISAGDPASPREPTSVTLSISADARIDNRSELCRALGLSSAAATDGELLLAGYARWGSALASKLSGDFAIAIHDRTHDRIYAARDAFGTRPLYFARLGTRTILSGELGDLLAQGVSPALDDHTILEYLLEDYRARDRTFFAAIRRIPPGHQLIADRHGTRVERWFHPPPYELHLPRTADYHAEVRRAFRASLEARLRSDHPLLAHLSGGLDSSAIVCMADAIYAGPSSSDASPRARPPLSAISAVYPGLPCDEREFIDAVLARVRIPGERFDATVSSFDDYTTPSLVHPGQVPTQGTTGEREIIARTGARVLLSGTGGDHLLFERGIFRDLAASGRWLDLARETALAPRYSTHSRSELLRDALGARIPERIRKLRDLRRGHREEARPRWLGPALRDLARARVEERDEPAATHTQRATWRWLTAAPLMWSVEVQQDHARRRGLELRFPFLDARLAELVLSIPFAHRLPRGRMKALLRDALAGILPEAIRERSRVTSFESSVVHHVRLHLESIADLIASGPWQSAPWVDRDALREVVARLLRDKAQASLQNDWRRLSFVWDAAMLELFVRRVPSLPRPV